MLTGDGELQEGSMWEAAMAAGHFGLDKLVCIVDRNRLQQGDRTEPTMGLDPLPDKFAAFGWAVRETDGHDYAGLLRDADGGAIRARQAQLHHRQHHQGSGHLVHRGPQGVAPPRAHATPSTPWAWPSWKRAEHDQRDRSRSSTTAVTPSPIRSSNWPRPMSASSPSSTTRSGRPRSPSLPRYCPSGSSTSASPSRT